MIAAIQHLAAELPLREYYNWDIPATLPITMPPDLSGPFERNLYLKQHLKDSFNGDSDLKTSFWIIQDWGGIKTFKDTKQNRQRIETFYAQLQTGRLTKDIHGVLPSLSKLAAFQWPETFSIYDSRAVFSLNWLLFCHSSEPILFPQPPGRSRALLEVDTQTLFRLSGRPYSVHSHKVAYFEYCDLLSRLSSDGLGKAEEPYYAEMLLFAAAPEWIPHDIRNRTTVLIKASDERIEGGQPAARPETK